MIRKRLEAKEKASWLRLARTPQVGPITFRELLRRFTSPEEALAALPDLARRGGSTRTFSAPSLKPIETEIQQTEAQGGRLIALCEPDYPEKLALIPDAPPVLTVLGDVALLHKPCLGIVGSRNASLNGRKMAALLAEELGAKAYVIASGLARGIDASAHHSALATGTIAAMAGGADKIYPEENRKLYEHIIESGCVISDQPLGAEPKANLFPRRNRLISGISLGVIVVEAARKSGSLITAHMALEQGREVFAVPGSPMDPRAGGTNELLRQGAVLTESAADIVAHLNAPKRILTEPPTTPFEEPLVQVDEALLDASREKIIENLSTCPIAVDELVRACQLSLPIVVTVLLELELAGRLERQPGHRVALIG